MEKVKATKKQRQELLDELLLKELEQLRLKCFKYQRRQFIWQDIKIIEADLDEDCANGRYTLLDTEKDYVKKHHIEINKDLIKDYIETGSKRDYWSKFQRQELTQTIRHELCHAFVYERYEHMFSDLKDKHADASPIFLSVLYWLEGKSNHNCVRAFKRCKFYKDIKDIKTFDNLDNYIFNTLMQYREITRKLKELNNFAEYSKNPKISTYSKNNDFYFASRTPCFIKHNSASGVDKMINADTRAVTKIKAECSTWLIGCCITPEMLEKLYYKKEDCVARKYVNKERVMVLEKVNEKINIKYLKEIEDRHFSKCS